MMLLITTKYQHLQNIYLQSVVIKTCQQYLYKIFSLLPSIPDKRGLK